MILFLSAKLFTYSTTRYVKQEYWSQGSKNNFWKIFSKTIFFKPRKNAMVSNGCSDFNENPKLQFTKKHVRKSKLKNMTKKAQEKPFIPVSSLKPYLNKNLKITIFYVCPEIFILIFLFNK